MALVALRAFLYATLLLAASVSLCRAGARPAVSFATATISGRHVTYLVVRLDRVRVETALGHDRVARMESLAQMALRHHALAAIDGGFFESSFRGPIKDLIDTTVVNGRLVFKGDSGSTLFFDAKNRASIAQIPLRIEGALDGSYAYPNNWFAYWINRYPENASRSTVTIFTPAWGSATGLRGFQVLVEDGVIVQIAHRSLPIPLDGYVIYVRGEPEMASHFRVGRRIAYRLVRRDGEGLGSFGDAWQAIGGGPRLLLDGRVALDPHAEGFHDPALFRIAERSIVGVTRDGRRLILATATGTLHQMARIMRRLGAYDAMNLDGGASSGLWAWGHYLTRPHRMLNNALLILPRKPYVGNVASRHIP
ncbi:MAG TPA: phosphodiester glycosidase family protein [Candidatus Dormibacteraeota bacterium]|nr:phosphodiester glycosidase family protein [Candidatus Dormibacteraeota bacterium]